MYKKKRSTLQPKPQSMVLELHYIIALRHISTPFTFLVKTCGFSPNTAQRALNGTLRQFNVNQITALCLHLNCTPTDLFALPAIAKQNLPALHSLHSLRKVTEEKPITIQEWLQGKSIEEVQQWMEENNKEKK